MRRRLAIFGAAAIVVLTLPGIAAAADTQVVVGRVIAGHGTLLVADSNQMTVYTFDKDVAGSGVSNCTGGCLSAWPAVTVPAGATPTGGTGVTGTLGTITRADNGALQVTYDGLPLYFFGKDAAPGDANGIYPGWKAVVLAAAVVPTASSTPPVTSTAPADGGFSTGGSPVPILFLAGIATLGLALAVRRLATRRS